MDEDMRNKRAKRFQDAQKLEQQRSKGKQLHPSMHIYGNRVQNASAYSHAATPEPEHNPVDCSLCCLHGYRLAHAVDLGCH